MANLRTNNLSGQGGRNAYSGSVFFDGTQSYLALDGSSDFAFGTADFTIEMWIKIDDDTNTNTIYDSRPSGSNGAQIALFYSGSSNAILFAHGGSVRITGTIDVGKDHSWHHMVLARQSGSTKLFVDGVQDGSTYSDSTSYLNPANRPFIGASSGTTFLDADTFFKGYISNVRVCIGHAVYFSNFTPPTSQLTPHFVSSTDKTALLCCQNSEDPTKDATGRHTIIANGSYRLDKGTGNLITNGLDWTGASDTESSTMPTNWAAGSGATAEYDSGGAGGGSETRMLRLYNDGSNSFINQEIPTVIGQRYFYNVWYRAKNSGLAVRIAAGESAGDTVNLSDQYNVGSANDEDRRTGFFIATATTTHFSLRIISGTNGASVYWDDVIVTSHNPIAPKVLPPIGADAGNTFGGAISMNSSSWMYFPTGRTEERVIVNNNFGARGLIMGGITYPGAGYQNVIESIQIASLGNAVDFGDLINKPNAGAGFSSKTRGFVAGGNTPDGNGINVIQFVTIATLGNATDFGDAGYSRANARGVSNNTRGVYSGGESASSPNPSINNIEFITMSTSGNGQDFGDLVDAGSSYATASSPTRGVHLGGYRDGEVNFIDFITIATTGNSQDFGDLLNTARNGNGGVSNGHRGIVMGGYSSPARTNTIQYVTIQSMGNAIDFGDLTDARDPAVTSSLTRGIACTGDYPANTNIIDFIEIMTTANAVDFGDMLTKTSSAQTCSNAHGGLADDM